MTYLGVTSLAIALSNWITAWQSQYSGLLNDIYDIYAMNPQSHLSFEPAYLGEVQWQLSKCPFNFAFLATTML